MTDQELDAALASALDVDHSPEFPVQVRRRVGRERRAGSWWTRRVVISAGVGASLAAAALVVAILRPGRAEPPSETDFETVVDAPPSRSAPAAVMLTPGLTSTQAVGLTASAAKSPVVARPRRNAPEVLVSAEEARAFNLLIDRASDGHIPAILPTDEDILGPPLVLSRLEIERVAIEPLSPVAGPGQETP